jgi:hypothetical protein
VFSVLKEEVWLQLLLQCVELTDVQFVLQLEQLRLLLTDALGIVRRHEHHQQGPVLHEALQDGRRKHFQGIGTVLRVPLEIAGLVKDGVVQGAGHHLVQRAHEHTGDQMHGDALPHGPDRDRPPLLDGIDQRAEQRPEQEVQIGHGRLTHPIEGPHVLQPGIHVVVHVGLEQEQGGQHHRGDKDVPVADGSAFEIAHWAGRSSPRTKLGAGTNGYQRRRDGRQWSG